MQSGNTIYGESGHNGHISHTHLAVVDNSHLADLLLISRITGLDFIYKAAVDLLHNLVDTGEKSGKQVDGPFFQRL